MKQILKSDKVEMENDKVEIIGKIIPVNNSELPLSLQKNQDIPRSDSLKKKKKKASVVRSQYQSSRISDQKQQQSLQLLKRS